MSIIIITIRQILVLIARLVRNALYIPYVISLILYLFFVLMAIVWLFLSNNTDINFVENILKIIFDLNSYFNFFDPNGSYSHIITAEETEKKIIYIIGGFALIYECITRIILFFKKDFNHQIFQKKILKIIKIFYGITFVISSIIFFIAGEFAFLIALLFILLMNICTLLIAYAVTNVFGFAIRILSEIHTISFKKN